MYEPKIYFLLFYREAISTDALIEKRLIQVESEEEGAVVGASSDVDVVAGSSDVDVDVVIGGSAVSQPTLKAPGNLPSSCGHCRVCYQLWKVFYGAHQTAGYLVCLKVNINDLHVSIAFKFLIAEICRIVTSSEIQNSPSLIH